MAKKHLSWLGVTSTAIALAAALLSPMPVAASGGTLFGLNPSPGAVFAINPSTGTTSKLADLPIDPTGNSTTFSGLASDPTRHLLFIVRGFYTDFTFTTIQSQVVTVDSSTGATSLSPAMSEYIQSDLAFDSSSGALFGVSGNQAPQSVVRIDSVSGAITHIADLPGQFAGRFAFDGAMHSVYVPTQVFIGVDVLNLILTVDTQTGVVSQSPGMTIPINQVVYDSSSGTLFGWGGSPASIFQIDTSTGAETPVAEIVGDTFFFPVLGIDSATHTIFVKNDDFSTGNDAQSIQSVNDQTGASTFSTGAFTTDFYINTLVFEGGAAITPDSVATHVRQAFDSGAIQGRGLEAAILSQLNAASSARSNGQCAVAARIYGSLINTIRAQSGRNIDVTTASSLITEIQFLIDHCP